MKSFFFNLKLNLKLYIPIHTYRYPELIFYQFRIWYDFEKFTKIVNCTSDLQIIFVVFYEM